MSTIRTNGLEGKRLVRLTFVFIFVLASAGLARGSAYGDAGPLAKPALKGISQDPDILLSAQCQLARGELERITKAAAENPQADKSKLKQARKRTARACLGLAENVAVPPRARNQPIAVPPVLPAEARLPTATTLSPLLPVARPSVITACDAGGCWDSQGVRLQRSGATLLGPQGPCIAEGALYKCP